jgi:hypothetical protein
MNGTRKTPRVPIITTHGAIGARKYRTARGMVESKLCKGVAQAAGQERADMPHAANQSSEGKNMFE